MKIGGDNSSTNQYETGYGSESKSTSTNSVQTVDGEKLLVGTDSALQFYGSAGATKYITTLSEQLLIWNQDSSSAPIKIQATDTSNGIQFNIAGTEMGRFTSTGLGIGTTPSDIFHVYGSATDSMQYKTDLGDGFDGIQLVGGNPALKLDGGGSTFVLGALNSGLAVFDQTNGAYRMIIQSDGKVGIGTDAPDRLLHVHGGDSSGAISTYTQLLVENNDHAYIQVSTPSNKYGGILFGDDDIGSFTQVTPQHVEGDNLEKFMNGFYCWLALCCARQRYGGASGIGRTESGFHRIAQDRGTDALSARNSPAE